MSCFAANPGKAYWNAIKHAIAYVKKTIDYRITYHHGASFQPVGFVNSDYANDKIIQRSTDRFFFCWRRASIMVYKKIENSSNVDNGG